MNNEKVSVIIPCFNQGQFVDEAVESVLNQSYQDFEIIIVDDGSTDAYTVEKLNNYNKIKTKIIHTTNQGLAQARNNGIKEASGKYILPLDADDKIADTYLEKAVKTLDENKGIGIVYCEAEFFGECIGKFNQPEYSLSQMLLENCIFCSGLFRKTDWEKVGGYKPIMKYGYEDWEFWISLIETGKNVYRIPETLFFYRQYQGSMLKSLSIEKKAYLSSQCFEQHKQLYTNNIGIIFTELLELRQKLYEAERELKMIKSVHNKAKIEKFIKIHREKRICFYGAGELAKQFIQIYETSQLNVLGFIDGNLAKKGQKLGNYSIYSLDDLESLNPDIIAITLLEPGYVLPTLSKVIQEKNLNFEIIDNLFMES